MPSKRITEETDAETEGHGWRGPEDRLEDDAMGHMNFRPLDNQGRR